MTNYTRETVIDQVKRQLKYEKGMQAKDNARGMSDLTYWGYIARIEFLEANLKYLNDKETPPQG